MVELKENDVYKFRYNAEYREKLFEPYHAFEGQFIVLKNRNNELVLVDTFWGLEFDQYNDVFTLEEAQKKGELRFICNLDEVEKIREYKLDYYDDKDTFILTEQSGCRKYYYKKKDAEKSAEKMENVIKEKIEDKKERIKWAKNDIERLEEKLEKVKNGEIDDVYI